MLENSMVPTKIQSPIRGPPFMLIKLSYQQNYFNLCLDIYNCESVIEKVKSFIVDRGENTETCLCPLVSHVGQTPNARSLESIHQVGRDTVHDILFVVLAVAAVVMTLFRCCPGLAVPKRSGTKTPKRGAVKVEANLFERVVRVAKSYANALVSSVEDPEKVLDQAVEDMQNDLIRLRQGAAEVTASEKRMKAKYEQAQKTAVRGYC